MNGEQISAKSHLAPYEANDLIRGWAHIFAPDDGASWEFVCECGDQACLARVWMTLAAFDLLRGASEPVLAPSHLRERAHAARSRSVEVREEARAVRNQAEHQTRRAARLARSLPASHYRFAVGGEVDDATARAFGDLTVTSDGGVTLLSGPVRGPTHLDELLTRIFDLGLTLLYVTALSDPT